MTAPTARIAGEESARDQGLARGVGLWSFTFSILNGVVGAGIVALPASMAAAAGGYAPFAYLAVALVMAAVVVCFAEGGSRVPTSGGAYGTVEAAFGKGAGFLAGIYMWLASVLACGGIAAALCDALGALVPALAGVGPRLAILLLILGGISWINVRSAGLAAGVIAWGTVIKLVPLGLFVAVGGLALLVGHDPAPAAVAPQGGHFSEAMLLALFAFCGMETPLGASGEVADPTRTVPRATILAMLCVLVLYVAIQVVAQGLLGAALAGSAEPLADGMRQISPALGLVLLAGGILSRFVWIGSDVLGAPRVLFAFARDGMLPAWLGAAHPRFATPHIAIWVHSAIAFALAATGTFTRLAILSTLATAGLYFLACAAALVLRRRGVAILGTPLSFRILPLAAGMGMASMVVLVAIARIDEILAFVGLTFASLALYAVMRPRIARAA
ncbi:APC family permease [Sphingomonas sp.]|uniref:APC family permease n=1 Tax=Sphingomonas sp. TaxID=28214 RepID=UPI003B3ADE84